MKLFITTLTMIFVSFGANSSDNEYFRDCKKLKNNIEYNIYNYFANFEKENLRKEPDHKERALNLAIYMIIPLVSGKILIIMLTCRENIELSSKINKGD